jgi:hypothetical protein
MATVAGKPKVEPIRAMQVIPGYPSLSDEARGVLKFLWRKSHVNGCRSGTEQPSMDRSFRE